MLICRKVFVLSSELGADGQHLYILGAQLPAWCSRSSERLSRRWPQSCRCSRLLTAVLLSLIVPLHGCR